MLCECSRSAKKNRIYVKVDGTEEIIEIIDEKTISTAGCIFVKQ